MASDLDNLTRCSAPHAKTLGLTAHDWHSNVSLCPRSLPSAECGEIRQDIDIQAPKSKGLWALAASGRLTGLKWSTPWNFPRQELRDAKRNSTRNLFKIIKEE